MTAIVDSAPRCIHHLAGVKAGDADDFILQAAYSKCEGIMTFGPGTTYGDGGHAAATQYYVLTVVGMIVTAAMLVAWVIVEHRRLTGHARRLSTPSTVSLSSADPPTAPPGA